MQLAIIQKNSLSAGVTEPPGVFPNVKEELILK
jgi:hypothetical protein